MKMIMIEAYHAAVLAIINAFAGFSLGLCLGLACEKRDKESPEDDSSND